MGDSGNIITLYNLCSPPEQNPNLVSNKMTNTENLRAVIEISPGFLPMSWCPTVLFWGFYHQKWKLNDQKTWDLNVREWWEWGASVVATSLGFRLLCLQVFLACFWDESQHTFTKQCLRLYSSFVRFLIQGLWFMIIQSSFRKCEQHGLSLNIIWIYI